MLEATVWNDEKRVGRWVRVGAREGEVADRWTQVWWEPEGSRAASGIVTPWKSPCRGKTRALWVRRASGLLVQWEDRRREVRIQTASVLLRHSWRLCGNGWVLSYHHTQMIFLNYLAIWVYCTVKRPWCWERLKVGGEGDDRGWDGWMASLTQWTWVWVNSGSWWWTGGPGVLRSMGLQRVRHDWATDLKWTEISNRQILSVSQYFYCLPHDLSMGCLCLEMLPEIFAFLYCSWSSHGKNTGGACHSLPPDWRQKEKSAVEGETHG